MPSNYHPILTAGRKHAHETCKFCKPGALRVPMVAMSLLLAVSFLACSPLINKDEREPITISAYPLVVAMSLEDLIVESDLIGVGEFVAIHPSRWSTINGKLPETATLDTISRQHLVIFSQGG